MLTGGVGLGKRPRAVDAGTVMPVLPTLAAVERLGALKSAVVMSFRCMMGVIVGEASVLIGCPSS